jgi:hypothetical protein
MDFGGVHISYRLILLAFGLNFRSYLLDNKKILSFLSYVLDRISKKLFLYYLKAFVYFQKLFQNKDDDKNYDLRILLFHTTREPFFFDIITRLQPSNKVLPKPDSTSFSAIRRN